MTIRSGMDVNINNVIKSRLDIVNVIEKTVTLTHLSGEWYTGATSSGSKSGTSLRVNARDQWYHNFASGDGGDIFNWLAFTNNLNIKSDFIKILYLAADLAGVQLKGNYEKEDLDKASERQSVHDCLTQAAEIYHKNLTPAIREYINKKWGISNETIDELKIGYAGPNKTLMGKIPDDDLIPSGLLVLSLNNPEDGKANTITEHFHGRVVFPYWVNGKVVNFAARGDKDALGTSDSEHEKKYKKLLTHGEKFPYVSKCLINDYIWGEDSIRGKSTCIITEGIADAIVLMQNGYAVLSPVTTKFAKHDIEDLVDIAKRMKTVYICNDNEVSGAGEDGAIRTGKLLRSHDVDVKIIKLDLPEGQDKIDVAEFFLSHTKEDFDAKVNTSDGLYTYIVKQLPVKPVDKRQVLKEFIKEYLMDCRKDEVDDIITGIMKVKYVLTSDDVSNVKKFYKEEKKEYDAKQRRERAMDDLKIDKKYEGMYTIYTNIDERVRVNPHVDKIADMILEDNNIVTYRGSVFIYRSGFYRNETDLVYKKAIDILRDICKGDNSNRVDERANDVMIYIKNQSIVHDYPFNNYSDAVPVKNGVILMDFETGETRLVEHDPDTYRFNYMLPLVYDLTARNNVIYQMFSDYVDNPSVLIQIAAQSIMQSLGYGPYKRCYLLHGKKNTGKSTLLHILQCFVGDDSVCRVGLEEISERFKTASLEGKLMNLYDDMGYFNLKETGSLKKLTGSRRHDIERKGVQPYSATLDAVHVFTTNTPAKFDARIKSDEAFWERWNFVTFEKSFKINGEFWNTTFTEDNMSALLNQVLEMCMKIHKNKKLPTDIDWYDVREKWMLAGNPLYAFVKENMTPELNTRIKGSKRIHGLSILKDDLLSILQDWCAEQPDVDPRAIPDSKKDLTELVNACGWESHAQKHFEGVDKEQWCYIIPFKWNTNNKYSTFATKQKMKDSNIQNY